MTYFLQQDLLILPKQYHQLRTKYLNIQMPLWGGHCHLSHHINNHSYLLQNMVIIRGKERGILLDCEIYISKWYDTKYALRFYPSDIENSYLILTTYSMHGFSYVYGQQKRNMASDFTWDKEMGQWERILIFQGTTDYQALKSISPSLYLKPTIYLFFQGPFY